jgi:hypothetical protein
MTHARTFLKNPSKMKKTDNRRLSATTTCLKIDCSCPLPVAAVGTVSAATPHPANPKPSNQRMAGQWRTPLPMPASD